MADETTDFHLEVKKGNIPGHSSVSKYGRNYRINTVPEVIWSGSTTPYPWIVTAGPASVVSDHINDDGSPLGTGARTVTIEGLNSSWAEQSETVTMNGIVPVVTASSWKRIHRMYVETVGSHTLNEGTIQATVDGDVVAEIPQDKGQTIMAVYTVPHGKTGYLWEPWLIVNMQQAAAVNYELFARENADQSDAPFRVKFWGAASTGNNYTWRPRRTAPEKFAGPCDIYMIAESNQKGTDVCGGFDITLVDDP